MGRSYIVFPSLPWPLPTPNADEMDRNSKVNSSTVASARSR